MSKAKKAKRIESLEVCNAAATARKVAGKKIPGATKDGPGDWVIIDPDKLYKDRPGLEMIKAAIIQVRVHERVIPLQTLVASTRKAILRELAAGPKPTPADIKAAYGDDPQAQAEVIADLVNRVEDLQSANTQKARKIAKLETKIAQLTAALEVAGANAPGEDGQPGRDLSDEDLDDDEIEDLEDEEEEEIGENEADDGSGSAESDDLDEAGHSEPGSDPTP